MPSAGERAYEEIRARVAAGEYSAGDRLREEELSSVIGVSRTPIREAIRRLAAEGLVEFLSHRGAHVASWSDAQLREIFELRALIEAYGAQRAANRIDEDALQRLEELAQQMEEAAFSGTDDAMEAVSVANNEFHQLVVEQAGSEHLVSFFAKVVQIPLVHRTFRRYGPDNLARSFRQHRELIDAFRAADAAWAESVMRSHILSARHIFDAAAADGNGADGNG
jgi:DNA-binding GntR family transcriptional regulator